VENLEPKKIETEKYREKIEEEKNRKARKEKNKANEFMSMGGKSSYNNSNTSHSQSRAGSKMTANRSVKSKKTKVI